MSDLKPTFLNDRDRITYLLGEYNWIIALGLGVVAVGLIAVAVFVQPDFPTLTVPTWFTAYLVWSVITLIPGYLAGIRVVLWLRNRNDVTVYEVTAPDREIEKWYVPPETWNSKTTEAGGPWPVNDREDWCVRQLDYDDETEQLHVKGVHYADLSPDQVVASQENMKAIYNGLMQYRTRYNQLYANWDEMTSDLQERLINEIVEARQRGKSLTPEAVIEIWEDAQDDFKTADELDLFDDTSGTDEFADLEPPREEQNATAEATFGTHGGNDE